MDFQSPTSSEDNIWKTVFMLINDMIADCQKVSKINLTEDYKGNQSHDHYLDFVLHCVHEFPESISNDANHIIEWDIDPALEITKFQRMAGIQLVNRALGFKLLALLTYEFNFKNESLQNKIKAILKSIFKILRMHDVFMFRDLWHWFFQFYRLISKYTSQIDIQQFFQQLSITLNETSMSDLVTKFPILQYITASSGQACLMKFEEFGEGMLNNYKLHLKLFSLIIEIATRSSTLLDPVLRDATSILVESLARRLDEKLPTYSGKLCFETLSLCHLTNQFTHIFVNDPQLLHTYGPSLLTPTLRATLLLSSILCEGVNLSRHNESFGTNNDFKHTTTTLKSLLKSTMILLSVENYPASPTKRSVKHEDMTGLLELVLKLAQHYKKGEDLNEIITILLQIVSLLVLYETANERETFLKQHIYTMLEIMSSISGYNEICAIAAIFLIAISILTLDCGVKVIMKFFYIVDVENSLRQLLNLLKDANFEITSSGAEYDFEALPMTQALIRGLDTSIAILDNKSVDLGNVEYKLTQLNMACNIVNSFLTAASALRRHTSLVPSFVAFLQKYLISKIKSLHPIMLQTCLYLKSQETTNQNLLLSQKLNLVIENFCAGCLIKLRLNNDEDLNLVSNELLITCCLDFMDASEFESLSKLNLFPLPKNVLFKPYHMDEHSYTLRLLVLTTKEQTFRPNLKSDIWFKIMCNSYPASLKAQALNLLPLFVATSKLSFVDRFIHEADKVWVASIQSSDDHAKWSFLNSLCNSILVLCAVQKVETLENMDCFALKLDIDDILKYTKFNVPLNTANLDAKQQRMVAILVEWIFSLKCKKDNLEVPIIALNAPLVYTTLASLPLDITLAETICKLVTFDHGILEALAQLISKNYFLDNINPVVTQLSPSCIELMDNLVTDLLRTYESFKLSNAFKQLITSLNRMIGFMILYNALFGSSLITQPNPQFNGQVKLMTMLFEGALTLPPLLSAKFSRALLNFSKSILGVTSWELYQAIAFPLNKLVVEMVGVDVGAANACVERLAKFLGFSNSKQFLTSNLRWMLPAALRLSAVRQNGRNQTSEIKPISLIQLSTTSFDACQWLAKCVGLDWRRLMVDNMHIIFPYFVIHAPNFVDSVASYISHHTQTEFGRLIMQDVQNIYNELLSNLGAHESNVREGLLLLAKYETKYKLNGQTEPLSHSNMNEFIVELVKPRLLGILYYFDTQFRTIDSKLPLSSSEYQKKMTNLVTFIKFVGSEEITSKRIKMLATLKIACNRHYRSASSESIENVKLSTKAWINFITCLSDSVFPDLSDLIISTLNEVYFKSDENDDSVTNAIKPIYQCLDDKLNSFLHNGNRTLRKYWLFPPQLGIPLSINLYTYLTTPFQDVLNSSHIVSLTSMEGLTLSLQQIITCLCQGLATDATSTKIRVLSILQFLFKTNFSLIQKSTFDTEKVSGMEKGLSFVLNQVIIHLVRLIVHKETLGFISRQNEFQAQSPKDLAICCLGALGALDPGRFTQNANLNIDDINSSTLDSTFILMNSRDSYYTWDSDEFLIDLFTILDRAYVSASEARKQDCIAFVIQELLALFAMGVERSLPKALPPRIHDTLGPFLNSHYKMANTLTYKSVPCPLFGSVSGLASKENGFNRWNTFDRWLVNWCGSLISNGLLGKATMPEQGEPRRLHSLFNVCSYVFKYEPHIAEFLLPSVALNSVLHETISAPSQDCLVMKEFKTLIDMPRINGGHFESDSMAESPNLNPSTGIAGLNTYSEEDTKNDLSPHNLPSQPNCAPNGLRNKCLATMFYILDYFNKWQLKHLNVIMQNARAKAQSRMEISSPKFCQTIKLKDPYYVAINSFLQALPYEKMAIASKHIKDHHRALMYYEIQYRRTRAMPFNTIESQTATSILDTDKQYEFLIDLYSDLNEPDGVTGVNAVNRTRQHRPSITEQIMSLRVHGNYQDSAACFEKAINSDPQNLSHYVSRVKSLLALEQSETAFTYSEGIVNRHQKWRQDMLPYQMEALRRLNRWDDLDNLCPESDHTTSSSNKNAKTKLDLERLLYACKIDLIEEEAAVKGNYLDVPTYGTWKSRGSSLCSDVDSHWYYNLGKAMINLRQNKSVPDLELHLKGMRETQANRLRSSQVNSESLQFADYYQRNYNTMLKIHLITDIECAAQLLRGYDFRYSSHKGKEYPKLEPDKAIEELLELSQTRLKNTQPTFQAREEILSLHRSLLDLAKQIYPQFNEKLHSRLGNLYLQSAKLARKSGYLQTAQTFLLNAESFNMPRFYVEQAKWYRQKGMNEQAIATLRMGLEKHFSLNAQQAADLGDTNFVSLSTLNDEQKAIFAKSLLKLGQFTEEGAHLDSHAILKFYKKVVEVNPCWENGYFHLAQHYDKLYQHFENDDQKSEMALFAIKYYGLALTWGHKFLYQSLPRLLTIWLDFGALANELETRQLSATNQTLKGTVQQNGVGRRQKSSPAPSVPTPALPDLSKIRVNMATINDLVRTLGLETLAPGIFLTAYPQLLSRICHGHPQVWACLRDCLIRVTVKHPQRAFWMTVAVLKSSHAARVARCREIFSGAIKMAASDRTFESAGVGMDLNKFLGDALKMADALVDLANREVESGTSNLYMSTNFRLFKKFLEDPNFSRIIIPLQSEMMSRADDYIRTPDEDNDRSFEDGQPSKRFKSDRPPATASYEPCDNAIYIAGIEDEIDVLPSLQRPKKIIFRATNGKFYPMLCKPKDDLRKDFRLMEFNSLVNACLSRHPDARKRNLKIRTYSVTPINEECGLIEWVPNMQAYRLILQDLYKEQGKVMTGREMLEYRLPANAPLEKKLSVYKDKLLAFFSPPVFHEWFMRSFSDPTSWYIAKQSYARTLAVMSMVGYVLGLGDRHGENILVDRLTGEILHVDFNCLFNKGLTFEYPERVEFRLTHNMIDAMGPLGYEGAFRVACEVTLQVMTDQRNLLMSVLRPFIYDPLLEWSSAQGRAANSVSMPRFFNIKPSQRDTSRDAGPNQSNGSAGGEITNHKAQIHVNNIELRLKGVVQYHQSNLADRKGELKSTTRPVPAIIVPGTKTKLQPVADEGNSSNLNSSPISAGSLPLSISGQVDYLIHQTTDENLLCQMYIGWSPFL